MRLSLPFCLFVLIIGCTQCERTIDVEGKVFDIDSKAPISNRKIILQALEQRKNKYIPVYSYEFFTDDSGRFRHDLSLDKNVWMYDFNMVGDSLYAFANNRLGLTELKNYGKYLSFYCRKLTDFTIVIERKSKTVFLDTLYVSWESDGMDGKGLYPYKIEHYGLNSHNNSRNIQFRWIGGDIESAIHTRVYADKITLVHWELFRNGEDRKITDTVFCKRDCPNYAYFRY